MFDCFRKTPPFRFLFILLRFFYFGSDSIRFFFFRFLLLAQALDLLEQSEALFVVLVFLAPPGAEIEKDRKSDDGKRSRQTSDDVKNVPDEGDRENHLAFDILRRDRRVLGIVGRALCHDHAVLKADDLMHDGRSSRFENDGLPDAVFVCPADDDQIPDRKLGLHRPRDHDGGTDPKRHRQPISRKGPEMKAVDPDPDGKRRHKEQKRSPKASKEAFSFHSKLQIIESRRPVLAAACAVVVDKACLIDRHDDRTDGG